MKIPRLLLSLTILSILLLQAGWTSAADKAVRVSAAASLGDVLKAINIEFTQKTGIEVEINLGASNLLARQIEEGAPVDVFLSADLAKMDALEKAGHVVSSTKEAQLSNALVVVVPADSGLEIKAGADLSADTVKKIAVGDPKAVPAGIYAKEWLTKLGQWSTIEPKLVPTESVRAALAAVESGNVDAGIVYKTDASISKKVKVAYEVPSSQGPQITYPMALIQEAKNAESGRSYLEFLDSKEAVALFEKFGFIVLPEAPAAAKAK